MPASITIASFIFGAVLLLIALLGGQFKIFGAEISGIAGKPTRIISAVLSCGLLFIGFFTSLDQDKKIPEQSSVPVTEKNGIVEKKEPIKNVDTITAKTIDKQILEQLKEMESKDVQIFDGGKIITSGRLSLETGDSSKFGVLQDNLKFPKFNIYDIDTIFGKNIYMK